MKTLLFALIAALILTTGCTKKGRIEPTEPMRKVTYNVQSPSTNCRIEYSTWRDGSRVWEKLDSVSGTFLHTFYIPASLELTWENRLQIYAEDQGWTKQYVFVLISINDTAYRPAGLVGRANAVYPP